MSKKTFIFPAVVTGWCNVVVKAESAEEAKTRVEQGDYHVEDIEYDGAAVEDYDDFTVLE